MNKTHGNILKICAKNKHTACKGQTYRLIFVDERERVNYEWSQKREESNTSREPPK